MVTRAQAPEISALSQAVLLQQKIDNKQAKAVVVGLGYVGLPLAMEVGRAGFAVQGYDPDAAKIRALATGKSYIGDVTDTEIAALHEKGLFGASTAPDALYDADVVSVCVPTPLRKTKDPDMSFIIDATRLIAAHIHPGMLIILESTTYPGTTEEVVLPILSESGLRVGEDFFLCFSPERVDPGNPNFATRNIPKVIGGLTSTCTELGAQFYGAVMDRVVPVSNPTVAEMVKLLENTFRMINIGLANEMAMMCHHVGVNVWEVIEAAATKPFGFMPFFPGPGLGGHCIPVDPHYLSWKIKQFGHEPRFIQLASEINGAMPRVVVQRVQDALNRCSKPLNGSRVHVAGVAYKRNVSDMRESPAIDIIELLASAGAEVTYSDPYVPRLETHTLSLVSVPLTEAAAAADCVLVCTDHSCVDYAALAAVSQLIVDTRNVLKGQAGDNIVRL